MRRTQLLPRPGTREAALAVRGRFWGAAEDLEGVRCGGGQALPSGCVDGGPAAGLGPPYPKSALRIRLLVRHSAGCFQTRTLELGSESFVACPPSLPALAHTSPLLSQTPWPSLSSRTFQVHRSWSSEHPTRDLASGPTRLLVVKGGGGVTSEAVGGSREVVGTRRVQSRFPPCVNDSPACC